MSGFELSAPEPVFRAIKLADLDLVLVGGHAVSFYAVEYSDRCTESLQYFHLLSKDADLFDSCSDNSRLLLVISELW